MIPLITFAATPSTSGQDQFCVCCTFTTEALIQFFQPQQAAVPSAPSISVFSKRDNFLEGSKCDDESQLHDENYTPTGPDLGSVSVDNFFIGKSDRSKSKESKHEDCDQFISSDSLDSNKLQMTTSSVSSANFRIMQSNRPDEPVVFAEMGQMLTRVGVKLERSAPPSRRGSPSRAITPNPFTMSPSQPSQIASPRTLFRKVSSAAANDPNNFVNTVGISSSCPRSLIEDALVSADGDAHLLKLQQACQQQMQEPSFSRRGSSELGIANDNEDHQITIRPRLGIADEKAPFKDTVFFDGREEECVRICPWRAQSPKIDRVISSGSPSTSVFSSELVYSSTTSHASTFSSSCMSAISSSSTNTGSYCNSNGGQMRDDEKMVNLSIAYSEVLQLQGKAGEAVTVVEKLLKKLDEPTDSLRPTACVLGRDQGESERDGERDKEDEMKKDRSIRFRSSTGNINLLSGASSPLGSEKDTLNRPLSPPLLGPSTDRDRDTVESAVPPSDAIRSLGSTDHCFGLSREQVHHQKHIAICHRRLGVLYKVVGRLTDAETSLLCYIRLKTNSSEASQCEPEVRNDIANTYCLLAAIVDEMDDRLDDAKEYDRLALDLMTHYK